MEMQHKANNNHNQKDKWEKESNKKIILLNLIDFGNCMLYIQRTTFISLISTKLLKLYILYINKPHILIDIFN